MPSIQLRATRDKHVCWPDLLGLGWADDIRAGRRLESRRAEEIYERSGYQAWATPLLIRAVTVGMCELEGVTSWY